MTEAPLPSDRGKAPAVAGCLDACRRCSALVSALASEHYVLIGPHLRHCVEHFDCLMQGLDEGLVDYDGRPRSRRLETDPGAMIEALDKLAAGLESIEAMSLPRAVRVRQSAAPGGQTVDVPSNLERELVFLSGHTIHHIAIVIRILEIRGVRPEGSLDVAFSTAAHNAATGDARSHV